MYRHNKSGIIANISESCFSAIPSTTIIDDLGDTFFSFLCLIFFRVKNAAGLGPARGGKDDRLTMDKITISCLQKSRTCLHEDVLCRKRPSFENPVYVFHRVAGKNDEHLLSFNFFECALSVHAFKGKESTSFWPTTPNRDNILVRV